MIKDDTIIALATPSGAGAIAVIRISGGDAITVASNHFKSVSGKNLTQQKSHTIHLGHIVEKEKYLDQVLVPFLKTHIPIQGKMLLRFLVMAPCIFNNRLFNFF